MYIHIHGAKLEYFDKSKESSFQEKIQFGDKIGFENIFEKF